MAEERPSNRTRQIVIALIILAGIAFLYRTFGPNRVETNPSKSSNPDANDDPLANALRRLEKDADANTCREVLQVIDSGVAASEARPDRSTHDLAKIGELARLGPPELDALAGKEFGSLDPEYLAECLLLRDAVRSLEVDRYPPEVQAALAFAWVCREVYLIEETLEPPDWLGNLSIPRWVRPAPPWWVLQEGSGCALDRAVVFLGMLRQMNLEGSKSAILDGCLIGPPQLADSLAFKAPTGPGQSVSYAPVRAVGVRVGKEILLFDPRLGQPIAGPDGMKPATFAQLRANPESSAEWLKKSGLTADEVKSWEVFLSGPISSYAPRMEWLQRQMATTNPVNLFTDLAGTFDRFQKESLATETGKCRYWNAPNDILSPTRLLASFDRKVRGNDGSVSSPLKDEFQRGRFPSYFIPSPRTGGMLLIGKPFDTISSVFTQEFAPVFLASGSPRDMMLRGQFSNALAALEDLDRTNTSYRSRIAREANLEEALKDWLEKASPIFAAVIDAERKGDALALAKANAEQQKFLGSSASERMVMLVRRSTSLLHCAEAKYLIALVVHERAERIQAQLDYGKASPSLKTQAARAWDNAADNWKVFLNNHPELVQFHKYRFAHARSLEQRCQQLLADAKK